MASQVPTRDGFQVAPEGRTPYVSSPTVENKTGEQLQQVGQAVQTVGAKAAALYEDRLREVNQLRIDEAISAAKAEANDMTYDENTGWAFQRGRDALDRESGLSLSEEYASKYDERLADIEQGLTSDAQRAAFARARVGLGSSFRAEINKHEAKEFETWALSVKSGVISAAQRDISLYYDDPDRTARNIDAIRGAMYEVAKLKGTDRGEHLEAAVRDVVSDSHLLAVSAMLENKDWSAAEKYIDLNRDGLTEEGLFKADVAIGREQDVAIATEAADDYIADIMGAERGTGTEEFIMPVAGSMTGVKNNFGQDRGTHNHGGIDIAKPAGTKISAAGSGVITRMEYSETYGNVVYISHDDGKTETRYAHMQGFAKGLRKGDRVQRGQTIGGVGSTGRSSGPHLHYEVRVNGTPVDPTKRHSTDRGAPGRSLADVLLAMRQDPRLRGHPERLKAAELQVRGVYTARKEEEREARADAKDAAFEALLTNGGNYSALPSNIRANIDGSDLPGLISFAGSVQKALKGPKPDSGSPTWAYTKSDVANGKIRSVSDLLPLRPYLSDADFKDLTKDVLAMQGGGKDASRVDSIKTTQATLNYVKQELAAIGINTNPKGKSEIEEFGKFQSALYNQIAVAEREAGRPLKGDESRKIALTMIAETAETTSVFLGMGSKAKRGYELNRPRLPYNSIPATVRNNIAAELRAAGITPTEAIITKVYEQRTYN